MAWSASLGGTALTIDAASASLDGAPFNVTFAGGHRSGVPRAISVDSNAVRVLKFNASVSAASKDLLIAAIAAINAKLRAGTTLVVQSNGATKSVTLNVLPSPPATPAFGSPTFELTLTYPLELTLNCEPYAYGAETTLVNAVATTYPAVVDFTVPGDYPAPLQVTFAGAGLHCLYAGLLPDQTLALPLVEAESLTWSGGTCAASPNADRHGGSAETNSSGTNGVSAVVDTSYPAGTYKMLGRLTTTGSSSFTVLGAGTVALAANAWRLDEFGTMRLPYYAVRGVVDSSYTIYMSGGTAYWDYVGAVPQSWGWAQWHPATGSTVTAKLVHEYDGRIYAADIADAVNGRSGGLAAVGAQRLVVFADAAHATGNATISLTTTVKVKPRYALWA